MLRCVWRLLTGERAKVLPECYIPCSAELYLVYIVYTRHPPAETNSKGARGPSDNACGSEVSCGLGSSLRFSPFPAGRANGRMGKRPPPGLARMGLARVRGVRRVVGAAHPVKLFDRGPDRVAHLPSSTLAAHWVVCETLVATSPTFCAALVPRRETR